MNYNKAEYVMGAAKVAQLPSDEGYEVAFAGRSNAGKSSALNALTHQVGLARVSKTPGRTQLINLFKLDDQRRLVDLPGYGYARVAESIKREWQITMEKYITERQCLKGIVLLVDSRHEVKPFDKVLIEMANEFQMPMHVLLTKCDKINNKEKSQAQRNFAQYLSEIGASPLISYQLFSSLTKFGMDQLKQKLDEWYDDTQSNL